MIQLLLVFAILLLIFMGIRRESYRDSGRAYDIVLVIGQSNAVGFSYEAPMTSPNTASNTCTAPLRDNVTINMSRFNSSQDLVNPNPKIWVLDRDPSWPVRYDRAEAYMYRRTRVEAGVLPAIEPLSYYSTSFNPQPSTNFSSQFTQRYVQANPGRNVLIINNAFEGVPLCSPKNDHELIRPLQWNICGNLYNTAIRRVRDALSWNSNNRVVAILWSQGEQDMDNGTTATTYRTELEKFVNTIRTDIGNINIPFLACGYSDQVNFRNDRNLRTSYENEVKRLSCTPFDGINGNRTVTNPRGSLSKFGFISTSGVGCDLPNNKVHFSFAGQRELGKRFYDVFSVIR